MNRSEDASITGWRNSIKLLNMHSHAQLLFFNLVNAKCEEQSEAWRWEAKFKLRITKGLAKCGLDGITIGNGSLINFSLGLDVFQSAKNIYLELLKQYSTTVPAWRNANTRTSPSPNVVCNFKMQSVLNSWEKSADFLLYSFLLLQRQDFAAVLRLTIKSLSGIYRLTQPGWHLFTKLLLTLFLIEPLQSGRRTK